jgi:hypothetical protein
MALHPLFFKFLSLSVRERNAFFQTSGDRLQANPLAIEKDFYVCLVLDAIYHGRPEGHPRIMFKGGTSLAKHGLIHRFSEDIDVVVFRNDLNVKDFQEVGISHKERDRRIDALIKEAARYIGEDLASSLNATLKPMLPTISIQADLTTDKNPVLLVRYETSFSGADSYIQPVVKIEGGARSALEPYNDLSIKPYVAEDWGEDDWKIEGVSTIYPQRTFLEKIMAMHGWITKCSLRPDLAEQGLMSRHYYDVALIASTTIGREAMEDIDLLAGVRRHSMELFGGRLLEAAVPGSIEIVPTGSLLEVLHEDYEKMQGMIFGVPPKFEDVMETVSKVEKILNALE